VNGTANLISDGCEGWLVPSEDPGSLAQALDRLAESRAELTAAGVRGRHRVETSYSIRKVAAMYLREYAAMLSETTSRRA
jgi:glycosyltransferase involved in cell wall biosynthesis